jgi:hypothetical protein
MAGATSKFRLVVPSDSYKSNSNSTIHCIHSKSSPNVQVEGEMGVAGFLVNFFKDHGVDLRLV